MFKGIISLTINKNPYIKHNQIQPVIITESIRAVVFFRIFVAHFWSFECDFKSCGKSHQKVGDSKK